MEAIELDKLPIYEEGLDSLVKTDLFVFLSRHRSSKGVASFTVHPLGNWAGKRGGRGKAGDAQHGGALADEEHAVSDFQGNDTGVAVTYEATHHGPLLETPSFFVEVGGSEEITDAALRLPCQVCLRLSSLPDTTMLGRSPSP